MGGASLASLSQVGKRKRFQEKVLMEDAGLPLAVQTRTANAPKLTLALTTLVIFAGSTVNRRDSDRIRQSIADGLARFLRIKHAKFYSHA